jgi:8-oxo-dGTP pyrophosphatase MutT (NUDIX family)
MFEIPAEQLPPGFLETIGQEPDRPPEARPASTVVLLRDAEDGPEILLMRRHRASGFVPGAWVFPGGRVDPGDSGPPLFERVRGLPARPEPRAGFWVAAVRELFEETGVLLARDRSGAWAPDAASSGRVAGLRKDLMAGIATLLDVLAADDLVMDASGTVHVAHWITPVVEPRRYDTHFFAAALPPGRQATLDGRELTHALWLSPAAALERFAQGDLPMVFPTVKTLQSLRGFRSADHALDALRDRDVPPLLPRIVRTDRGVAMVLDD